MYSYCLVIFDFDRREMCELTTITNGGLLIKSKVIDGSS